MISDQQKSNYAWLDKFFLCQHSTKFNTSYDKRKAGILSKNSFECSVIFEKRILNLFYILFEENVGLYSLTIKFITYIYYIYISKKTVTI